MLKSFVIVQSPTDIPLISLPDNTNRKRKRLPKVVFNDQRSKLKYHFYMIFYLLLFALFQTSHAELVTVDYELSCTAKIDTKVISKADYQSIYSHWDWLAYDLIIWGDLDFQRALEKSPNLSQVIAAKKREIHKQFKQKESILRAPGLDKWAFWKDLRDRGLKALRFSYALANAQLDYLATNSTKQIVDALPNKKVSKKCERYFKALKDVESLKSFAPIFAQERCADSEDPDRCKKDHSFQGESANSLARLRYQIINLGLYNCDDFNMPKVWSERETRELKKLVSNVKCIEP